MNFSEEEELKNQIKFKKDFEKLSGGSSSFVMPEVQIIRETLNGKSKTDSDNIIENSTGFKKVDLQNIEEMFNDKGKINPGINESISTSDVRENNETANDKTNVNSEKTFETDTSFKASGVQNIRDVLNGDEKADLEILKNENILDSTEGTSTSGTSFGMSDLSDKSNSNTNSTSTVENKEQVIETIDLSENKDNNQTDSTVIKSSNDKTETKPSDNIEVIDLTEDKTDKIQTDPHSDNKETSETNNDKKDNKENKDKVSKNTDEQNKTINNDEKAAKPSSQNGTFETQDLDLSNGESQSTQQNVAASSYGGGIFIDYAYLDESIKLIGRELVSGCQSVNILYTEYNKINIKNLDIKFDRDYFERIKTSLDKMFKNTNDEKTEFKTLKKKLKKLQDKCKETDVDYEIKFEMQYVNNFFSEFGDDLSDTEKALIFEEYSKHITETINGQENKQAYMNKLGFKNLDLDEYLNMLSQASDGYKYQAVTKVMSKPESERTAAEKQAMDKWFSAVKNIDNDELNAVQLLTKSMLAQDKALTFVDAEGNITDADEYSYYVEMSQSAQEGFVVKYQLGADSVDSYRIVPLEDGGCELFVTINGVEQLITDENKPEVITNLNEIKDFLVFRVQAKYNNQANFYAKEAQKLKEEHDKINEEIKDKTTIMSEDSWGVPTEVTIPDTPEVTELRKKAKNLEEKMSLYSKYCESFQNKSFEANKMYSDYKKLSSQCPIESYSIEYVPSSTGNGVGHTEVTFYSDKDKTQPVEPSEEQIAFFLNKENLSVNDLMTAGAPLHGYDLEDIKAFQKAGTDNLTILNYVQNKYGVDASEYYSDYVKDLGRRVIGKEMAQHRIDVLDDIDSDFVDGLYVTLCGTGDGLTQFVEGIGNLFGADGEVSSREYMVMDFSEYLASNYSTGAIMVGAYEISTSIGNMLPSIALSFVPGVGQALSIASIGLSCAGNAREEGLQMGMTEGQAWAYGIVSGSLEACLQFFLGGIKPLQKGGSQLMENELKNILIDMGKEAREEMLQEVLNPIYLNIIMNWDGDDSFLTNVLNSFTSAYEGSQNIEMEQVMKAGIYAVITAGVMNSPSNVRNITSKLTTGNSVTYAYLIQKYRGQDLSYSDVMSNLKNDIDVIANNDVKINQLVESLKANPDFEAQFNSYNEQIINPDNRISFDEYALTTAIETILTVNKPLINSTETITNVNDVIVQSTIDTLNSQKDSLTDLKSKVEEKIKANEEIMNNTELDNATRINAESENIGLREKVKEIDKSIEAISNELNQPTIKSTNITEAQVASRLADLLFTVPENQETMSKNAFTKVKEFFINKFGNIEEQTVSEGIDYTVYNISELNSQKTEIQNKISELESKGTELTEEEKITLEKYKSSLERINKVIELKNKLPKTNEEKTLDELIESRNEIQEEILAYDAVIEGLNTGNYSAYTEEIEAYKKAYAPRIESLRAELQTIDNLIENNYSEEIDSSKISNKTAYDINSLKEKLIDRKTELEKTVEELEASLKSNTDEQLVENIDSELSSIKEKINTIDEMLADFTLFENTMAKVTSEIKSNEVQEIVEAKDVESLKPNTEESESVVTDLNKIIEEIVASNGDTNMKFEQIKETLLNFANDMNVDVNELLTVDVYSKIEKLYGENTDLNTFEKVIKILSDANTSNLKKKILSKITPNMTELEKARLIYLELGKCVNYDEQFKYYMKSKLDAEADSIYYQFKQIKDLETNNKIICVHWAQLYSEMLQDAGISGERIFVQRLIDPTTGKYVHGSHAGIYVKLNDGSFIMPDITAPLGKASDLYNVKMGNTTTGFVYFSKEDVIEIINSENMNPIEFDTGYELKNMFSEGITSQITESDEIFLRHNGKMLFGMEVRSDIQSINKKLRIAREMDFYNKYKIAHNDYVNSIDAKLSEKVSDLSDMFTMKNRINNIIERFNNSKENKSFQFDYLGIEDGRLTSKFFGLNTINTDSMIDVKAYISEMTEMYKDKLNFDLKNSIFFKDNKTIIGLMTENADTVLSYKCEIDENGKIVIKPDVDLGVEMISGNKKLTEIEKKEKISKLTSSMINEFKLSKEKSSIENTINEDVELDQISSAIDYANYRADYHDNFVGVPINSLDELTYSHLERVNNRELVEFQIAESNEMITWEDAFFELKRKGKIPEDSPLMKEYQNEITRQIGFANYRAVHHDNFMSVKIDSILDLTEEQLRLIEKRDLVSFQVADKNGEIVSFEDAFIELKRNGKIPEDSPLMKEYYKKLDEQIGFANYRATKGNYFVLNIDSLNDLSVDMLMKVQDKNLIEFNVTDMDGKTITWDEVYEIFRKEGKVPDISAEQAWNTKIINSEID